MPLTLLTVEAAARRLGVPKASLLRAAEQHGFLILVGRAQRLREDELERLINKCRREPRAPASTFAAAPGATPSGSSGTRAGQKSALAHQLAERLKTVSRPTSQKSSGKVLPLRQTS